MLFRQIFCVDIAELYDVPVGTFLGLEACCLVYAVTLFVALRSHPMASITFTTTVLSFLCVAGLVVFDLLFNFAGLPTWLWWLGCCFCYTTVIVAAAPYLLEKLITIPHLHHAAGGHLLLGSLFSYAGLLVLVGSASSAGITEDLINYSVEFTGTFCFALMIFATLCANACT